MNHMGFLVISILEYIGMLSIMLAVYRFEIKHHYTQILFIAIMCSLLSHLLFINYQNSYAPIIQLVALIILVRIILQVRLFYASIMSVSVITVYSTAQGVIIWGWSTLSNQNSSLPVTSITMYSIQIFSTLICIATAWYLQRKRIGVSFIPTSIRDRFYWSRINRLLLTLTGITVLVLWLVIYLIYIESKIQWSLSLMALHLIVSAALIIMVRKKDERKDD